MSKGTFNPILSNKNIWLVLFLIYWFQANAQEDRHFKIFQFPSNAIPTIFQNGIKRLAFHHCVSVWSIPSCTWLSIAVFCCGYCVFGHTMFQDCIRNIISITSSFVCNPDKYFCTIQLFLCALED